MLRARFGSGIGHGASARARELNLGLGKGLGGRSRARDGNPQRRSSGGLARAKESKREGKERVGGEPHLDAQPRDDSIAAGMCRDGEAKAAVSSSAKAAR